MDIFGNFEKIIKKVKEEPSAPEYAYSDPTLEGISKVEDKQETHVYSLVKFGVAILFCVLILKIFALQVISGEANKKIAEGNRIRPRIIEAQRGIITDKSGDWLARNEPYFVLAFYPCDLPKKQSEREEVYRQVAEITSLDINQIKSESEKNGLFSLDYFTLLEGITHDDALILRKRLNGIPGISIINKSQREYAALPGLSHLLGYIGKVDQDDIDKNPDYYLSDNIGKTGLELSYEKYLRGQYGVEQVEVNSKGNVVRILVKDGRREPVPGDNLTLYLDRGLQQKTAEALQNGIEQAKTVTGTDVFAGVAAVMNVKTGGILSLVALPSYDNNLFSGKISDADYKKLVDDPTDPMFNRAIAGTYPPGSISKIILASAGLSEGTINKNTSLVTPAAIQIEDYTFPDWKDHSYESTNVERALAESNNVFFYSVGGGFDKIRGLGIDKIKKYWQLFGLGEKTGIDLTNEASGLLPDAVWKKKARGESWYLGDTYHVSIGQGDLLVTPIQMLRATATIANGGKLLQPQLVSKVSDQSGKVIEEYGPRVERENFINPEVIRTVQQGMRMAVTDGSARNLNDLPISIAAKTGTAQFSDNQKTHAWFEAYAPYENPEIAVIVMVEGGGGGNEIAAPVAKEILNYYFTR